MNQMVYADNAATTALSRTAFEAMLPYLTTEYGNPSSVYSFGSNAKRAIQNSREKVASAIGALPEEIYFTSGGTESDNWAIKSASKLSQNNGKHIISTAIEHHAVLHTLDSLKEQGYEITSLGVDTYGQISLQEICSTIKNGTSLISIMAANNEVGTILPTVEIGAIARERGILFHTDAVQAVGHIPIDVCTMNIDMLSLAGHKFRGPKGIGALYINKSIKLPAIIHGGGQEHNLRSGTENVAGIVGLGAALDEACTNMKENMRKVSALRDRLISGVMKISRVKLTGDPANRLPGIASFIIEGIEGESMVMMLDHYGICASSGSACTSGTQEASHVLLATGIPSQLAHSSLRFSLNEDNSVNDVDYILEKLPVIVSRLRNLSPVWKNVKA